MSIDSVVTALFTCDPFSILVRALTAKVMVMSSNPKVYKILVSEVICTE
jgi:hypothetical protein